MLHKSYATRCRRKFIYFNDDVLLGAETWPDDFLTPAGAPRIYLAMGRAGDVQTAGMDTWLGDGTCDASCNVSACEFDRGDCDGVAEAVSADNKYVSSTTTTLTVLGGSAGGAAPRPGSGTGLVMKDAMLWTVGMTRADCASFWRRSRHKRTGRLMPPRHPVGTRTFLGTSARTARFSRGALRERAGVRRVAGGGASGYWCWSTRTRQMRRPGAPSSRRPVLL